MLTIDGSRGEGGGQVLRSALGLALATGQAVHLHALRARRKKPGLQRQHLACVRAAAAVGAAEVTGAELGSSEVTFRPQAVCPGHHRFAIGSAGSTTLVVQTVLPALVLADGPSTVVVEGGTHNMLAPSFDFLERVFLPQVARMGPRVRARLERHGFQPAGGGRLVVEIEPVPRLVGFELLSRGALLDRRAVARLAAVPRHIGERELATIGALLDWPDAALSLVELPAGEGPGNVVLAEVEFEHVRELTCGIGERGRPAERVARDAAERLRRYLAGGAPVGEHLADQLLLPLALAGGGAFRTGPLSLHARTHMDVIRRFLPVAFDVREGPDGCTVEVRPG